MNSTKLTNALLLVCIAILGLIAARVWSLPTYAQVDARVKSCEEQVDARIQHWGQHFGQHFGKH